MKEALTVNGWQGHVSLFGLTLPNWLVPMTALGAAGSAWARARDTWDASPKLILGLAAYGAVHLVILFVVLLANPGQVGIGAGAVISLLGSLTAFGVAVLVVLSGGDTQPVATATPRRQAFSTLSPTPGYPTPSQGAYPAPSQPSGNYPAPNAPVEPDRILRWSRRRGAQRG